jgi:hypothetical protein
MPKVIDLGQPKCACGAVYFFSFLGLPLGFMASGRSFPGALDA